MTKYAILDGGKVANIVVADAVFAASQGWIEAPDDVEIGWTHDGEFAAPVRPLNERKAAMRAAVTAEKLRREGTTAPTPQGAVQSDTDSRNKLNGAVLLAMLAQGGQPFEIAWTMADNTNVTFDGPGLIARASAVGQYVAACHAHGQALKTAIDAAADHDALDAIDIGAGWP
jgi:hypothetical protein